MNTCTCDAAYGMIDTECPVHYPKAFGKLTDAQRKSWAAELWRGANKTPFFKPLQGNVLLVTPGQRFKARVYELFVRRPRDAWQILWHGRYVLTDAWLDEHDRVSIQLVEENE